ncbi:hypothetical protein N7486_006788 [Penicillium sp. IBT 16267x]|nr:hypothetical protein N7486_006788 [Penicillium sp. IBT 16267x]
MLLAPSRDAHISQYSSDYRHNDVLPSAKDNLGLRVNWRRKIGVSFIFSVGLFGSVAASFRLAHTVSYAESEDIIYIIGPILFWACAEMTCGFLIFSMPCLSKLIMESGRPGRVKSSLGFSPKSSEPSHRNSDPPFPSARSSRLEPHSTKPPLEMHVSWPSIEECDIDMSIGKV